MSSAARAEHRLALVVEDDPWVRRLEADALAEAGFRVIEASNGWSALRLVREQRPDLVVLDVAMPETSGLEVLRALSSGPAPGNRVPVLVVTGHPDAVGDEDRRRAFRVLSKPLDVNDLLDNVGQALADARRRQLAVPGTARARTRHLRGRRARVAARTALGRLSRSA